MKFINKIGRFFGGFKTKNSKVRRITLEDLRNQKVKLGFGFNRLPYDGDKPDFEKVNEIVDTYMQGGCVYFETAYNYMKFQSEDVARKCLVERYPRESFILCDKMPIRYKELYQEGLEKMFERQLKKCAVDYFDVYLIHNVGKSILPKLKKYKAFEFLQKIKKAGKASLVGFSFHDSADVLDQILTEHPEVDIVQLQINYQDWESNSIQSRLCYEVAQKHGKTVTVMEPLKGGKLVKRLPEDAVSLIEANGYTPADLGLRFVASLEDVAVVLSGMGAKEQAEANAKSLSYPWNLDEKGYEIIDKVRESIMQIKQVDCTNCGYCVEICPKNIPINNIFEIMNSETKNGRITNRNASIFYKSNVAGRGKASDCIKCGMCEDVCSQRLEVRKELAKAAKLFERK